MAPRPKSEKPCSLGGGTGGSARRGLRAAAPSSAAREASSGALAALAARSALVAPRRMSVTSVPTNPGADGGSKYSGTSRDEDGAVVTDSGFCASGTRVRACTGTSALTKSASANKELITGWRSGITIGRLIRPREDAGRLRPVLAIGEPRTNCGDGASTCQGWGGSTEWSCQVCRQASVT